MRLVLVIICAALATVAALAINSDFERASWPIYDFFQRQTALEKPQDVVLVLVTQTALEQVAKPEIGFNWPWPRELQGDFVKTAADLHAKSVIFDVNFQAASGYGVADDQSFHDAIAAAKIPVIMPGPDGARMTQGPAATIANGLTNLSLGVTTVPQDADGIYRRMPKLINDYAPLAFARAKQEFPVDWPRLLSDETLWLRFYKQIEFVDIANVIRLFTAKQEGRALTPELQEAAGKLAGRHWIIGANAPGLLDLKATPVNPYASGSLVHATALENVIQATSVKLLTRTQIALLTAALALVVFAILLYSSTPIPALIGATFTTIIGAFAIATLSWVAGTWYNPLPALASTGVLALIVLAVRFQLEWRERERLAKTVENSMSSEMVELVRSGKLKLTRFGERREVSIFFCDLSGFTTISETLDAAKLVEVLNLYMQETVDLIFRHHGFVDKFIGDAVMALWGAPVNSYAHAKDALEAATKFQDAFARFKDRARAVIGENANELSARAGAHSGTAIVGNIGANERYNYTAIGDPVNLASRLEGLGKQYDTYLLLSEELLIAAGRKDEAEFIELDRIAVKGRSSATRIYTYDPRATLDQKQTYAKALDFYRHARFAEAVNAFEAAAPFGPAIKMAERSRSALKNGTPKSYKDGVWHFDEK